MRRMPGKFLLSTLLTVALTASVVTIAAAPASAAPAPASSTLTPLASCAQPPSDATATDANRDRFVTLWAPRVKDKAWFTNFIGLTSVPPDIAAEGFNAMPAATQSWLVACLVDNLVAASGQSASQTDIANYQFALDAVIFGKSQIDALKDKVNSAAPPSPALPGVSPSNFSKAALEGMVSRLGNDPGVTTASLPTASGTLPAAAPSTKPNVVTTRTTPNIAPHAAANPLTLASSLQSIINLPIVQLLLKALDSLLKLISKIQAVLFTLPVVNLLSTLTYKVCAESATQPLACSVSVPIGVPVPTDVTGDHFPDVLAEVIPSTMNGQDFGVTFNLTKLSTAPTPLAAHVFIVYDVPLANKRVEYGYDGRASSLANITNTKVIVRDLYRTAVTGDVNVDASVTSQNPGAIEALTFAIKDLVNGSPGNPPTEANPVAGSVQFNPFPKQLTMNAHLIHTNNDEDVFTLGSSTASTVNALITQDTTATATTPASHRQFTALIDKLPTSVTVDLTHDGGTQNIAYNASSAIAHVQATDTAYGDTTNHPGSYTHSVYDVLGVPASINVTLTGAQDITYNASSSIPQATMFTETYKDTKLQQEITAQAQGIPSQMHVTNNTGDTSTITYDANAVITSIALSMYDLTMDKTNLLATATSIPTHLQFFSVKSSGLYDLSANAGIGLITATLTRGGDPGTVTILPDPGVDHATIYKRGDQIGVDFQLSGFKSAHFENSTKMILGLGLSPGGQAFDAIADIIDVPNNLNILANAHITQLPSSISLTDDPTTTTYTYTASSPINAGIPGTPDVGASITLRDTGDVLSAGITNIPAQIEMQMDSANSIINWNASAATGKVQVGAHVTAATLHLDRALDAGLTITSIPATWSASYAGGNVDFQAPSPGIGSIDAWVTNHGTHETMAGDFLAAYYNEAAGDLDAALHISNLQRAHFSKVTDDNGGGFTADLNMGNHSAFNFSAEAHLGKPTETTELKAVGSFDPLPAQIHLESVGGRIRYSGDTNPTLRLAVSAGSPGALATAGDPVFVHGVSIRDGQDPADHSQKAVKADLYITGLPDSLDLNTPEGQYSVGNFNPSVAVLAVDAQLKYLAPEPVTLELTQDVGTGPVSFVFGPFVSSTDADGTHRLNVNYTASRQMNAFDAEVTYSNTDDALLHISNIPGGAAPSVSVNTAFGSTDTVDIDMTQDIANITAKYRHVGDATFGGVVQLTDVPHSVHLKIGSETTGDNNNGATAPQFTMNASSAGLDINAFATAAIVNASAQVKLGITDMGQTVTGNLVDKTLNITSTPATGSFQLEASGRVHVDVDLGFSAGPFHNTGTLGLDIVLDDVALEIDNFSQLGLALGVTTGITGQFAEFKFSLVAHLVLSILDRLTFDFSLPIIGDEHIELLFLHDPSDDSQPLRIQFGDPSTGGLIPNWHVQTNQLQSIFSVGFSIPYVIECHAGVDARPGVGSDTGTPGFDLTGPPPGDGTNTPAYLVTPGVLGLSGFLMDLVGFFESPYGNDIEPDIGCS